LKGQFIDSQLFTLWILRVILKILFQVGTVSVSL